MPEKLDFLQLVQSVKPVERKTAEVDVSRLFPGVEGGVTFVYQDLQTKELFSLPSVMEAIKFQRDDYPQELAGTIALLATCHTAPLSETQGMQGQAFLLYCELADRLSTEDWVWLVTEFTNAFPHLSGFDNAVEERKKK